MNRVIRLNKGPTPGVYPVDWSWPFPEKVFTDPTIPGYYEKVRESQLDEGIESEHVMRGAEYDWVPAT